MAVIDSASATASALASLLEVHGLNAPTGVEVEHLMLTTGHVLAFHDTAERLFGSPLPMAQPVALGALMSEPVALGS